MSLRDNVDELRLGRIDEILKHLHQLEKDTGKIIGSVQRERRRAKANLAIVPAQKAASRTRSRKVSRKR
jgi:hypothetical protein